MKSIRAIKRRSKIYRMQRKLHAVMIDPARKLMLYAALHVMRAEDIVIEVLPTEGKGKMHVVLRRKGSNAQISARVRYKAMKPKAFENWGICYKTQIEWIRFYSHRTDVELLPESSD